MPCGLERNASAVPVVHVAVEAAAFQGVAERLEARAQHAGHAHDVRSVEHLSCQAVSCDRSR